MQASKLHLRFSAKRRAAGKRVSKLKGPRDPTALSSLRLQRTGLSGWETSGFRPDPRLALLHCPFDSHGGKRGERWEAGRGSHAAVPELGASEIRAEPQAAGRQERASWKPTSEALAQPCQQPWD